MKLCVVLLCGALAGAWGYVVQFSAPTVQPRFATSSWLHRQKLVLELFDNVCEESQNPMIIRVASEFSIEITPENYSDKDAVTNFRYILATRGLLPKDEIFSEYRNEHLQELQVIYNLFYYANDFDVFYNTAAWARQSVNCEIFVDALYAVILHRRDTEKFAVPAPYEILPNYFVSRDALAKAMLLQRNGDISLLDMTGVNDVGSTYTVNVNYTGTFIDNDEESKISYFLEDVGLNTYNYFIHLNKGQWLNRDYSDNYSRGEYWYYVIRQLNARYNLERYTNGLGEIESVSWTTPVRSCYDSMLMYRNGKYIPERDNKREINTEDVTYLTDFENHIDSMVQQMGEINKTVIMNTIFDLITAEDKNYDWTARGTLGDSLDIGSSRLPSVLEHYATSLRDPVFWQLNKNILNIFNVAMKQLRPYAHNELYYPGVEIMNVEVKKMQTYFDYHQFEITDSVKSNAIESLIHVKIGQPRLNHKPFSIMVNVTSLVAQKALVKIFIGPKFLPTEIELKKDILKQLDSFEYTLKIGTNLIIKKSDEINNIADDFLPLSELFKKVEAAELGLEPLYFTERSSIVGYPSRLILPKGTTDGIPLQLYVMIIPFVKTQTEAVYDREFNADVLSPGFPFDRRIDDAKIFDLPNTMFKNIVITHKGDNKVLNYGGVGMTKKWYTTGTGTYDPETRKTFDYSSKKQTDYKAYDYKSKKGKYEPKKIIDYEAKKTYRSTTEVPDMTTFSLSGETTTPEGVYEKVYDTEIDKSLNVEDSVHNEPIANWDNTNNGGIIKNENVEPLLHVVPIEKFATDDSTLEKDVMHRQLMKRIEDGIDKHSINVRTLEDTLKVLEDDDSDSKIYY